MRMPAMTATQAFAQPRFSWYGAKRRPGQDLTRIEASGKVFLNDFAFHLIDCLQAWGTNVSAAGAKDFVEYAENETSCTDRGRRTQQDVCQTR